ncbi:hypothetical protein [Methylocella sp.]|uniref:hypothetical protein n=1 Tax=Methylocella sp. TaxID=1978226 RepID=UPI003784C496
MSEPASKRQPLIDLYEFERRMRAALPESGAAAAEAAAHDRAPADEVISAEGGPFAPAIGGDFAEIEAALLRAADERAADPEALLFPDLRASRDEDAEDAFAAAPFAMSDADRDDDAPGLGLAAFLKPDAFDGPVLPKPAPDHFVFVDDAAVEAGLFEEEKRSRRPLYVMAVVAIAGAAGMIATTAFRQTPTEAPALIEAASVAPQIVPAPAASEPQQHAAALSETPAAAPEAATAMTAPVMAALPGSSLLAPPPYGAPGAQPVAAMPAVPEPKLVKTAVVRPDGALAKPHVAAVQDHAVQDHAVQDHAVQTRAAEADAARPETAKPVVAKAEVVKPVAAKPAPKTLAVLPPQRPGEIAAEPAGERPAAEKPTRAAKARDAAKARAAQAAPAAAPAQQDIAAAQPQAAPVEAAAPPAPKPSPLAFVDTAVNSITGATSKIIDWGRSAANLAHN